MGKALFGEASGDSNWTTVKKIGSHKERGRERRDKGFYHATENQVL